MNLQMFTKFGANRSSRLVDFPDFCILGPPKTPQNAPWNIEALIVVSLCPSCRVPVRVSHVANGESSKELAKPNV